MGLVCDGNTGEIVYCGDIKKHLFIELHTAPEADTDFRFASNIDNILLELYCIPILAEIYKKEIDCQIEITKDLENIAVWFQIFSSNNNTGLKNATIGIQDFIRSKEEIIDKLDPEFVYQQYTALKNYIDAEYQLQLPLKKRFQNFFIKIFARIDWLQRNIIDIFVAEPDFVLDFEPTLIDTEFKTLLIESVSIAKDNLADQILKNKPFATVLRLESSDYPAIESAILTSDADNLYHKYPAPPGFYKRDESAGFVSIIASGLGIAQHSKVKEIIKLRKYVFTRDFAFKLLFVHDRMKARENVLFEGDTGVGKTELLSIYSYLVNFTSNFDGCHSLRKIITNRIHTMEGLDETTEKTAIYSYTKDDIFEEIDRLLKPEGNFNIVVPALLREISQVLQNYPLVDIRSKVRLSKAISCINDGGDWKAIIENNDHVNEIIENICEFEYISLFYPIRMHNTYSVIDLHNDITKITSKAIEIGEKTNGKATFVVFVNELNTTSIMGPMQSIFCDRMYDGKPLPLTNAFVTSYIMTLTQKKFRDSSHKDYSLFQLRDYILFLRFLREHEGSSINSAILLNALERNFNGIEKEVFRNLVQFWFKKVNDALRHANKQELPMPKENDFTSNIELMRENLDYRLLPKKDPNTAAYRFILVIDPTDNETAVSLLYSTKLCKPERENIEILENFKQIPTDIFDVNKYSDTFEVIEVLAVKAFKSHGRIRELSFVKELKFVFVIQMFILITSG